MDCNDPDTNLVSKMFARVVNSQRLRGSEGVSGVICDETSESKGEVTGNRKRSWMFLLAFRDKLGATHPARFLHTVRRCRFCHIRIGVRAKTDTVAENGLN